MKDVGWIPAGELSSGDPVKLKSDEYVPIDSYDIIILDEPIKVYNFEVEDNHNYYVSENEVLVHNGYENHGNSVLSKKLNMDILYMIVWRRILKRKYKRLVLAEEN